VLGRKENSFAPNDLWIYQEHLRTVFPTIETCLGEATMPYGRCVIYSFSGDADEVIERSRNGILPIFKKQPGFMAYGVMVQNGQIVSVSAWASEADARAADEAAKQWVSENMDAKVVSSFVGDYAWLEFAPQ
jgi:hypothetical protein